jgi:SOS-response transcriptional repressor LexA
MEEIHNSQDDLKPINLVDCGLDDVVAALLARQPIATTTDGAHFTLDNDNARKIFAYYARNRTLWPQNKPVQANEIAEVLKALLNDPPARKETGAADTKPIHLWKLRRIEAHRFAGLHRHCGEQGDDPDAFVLDIERDVTLVSGFNGAGKTALQNVIIWCLTGKALRSQHMPDEIHEPMDVSRTGDRDNQGDSEAEGDLSLPPVVPIPSGADLEALGDQPKIDSWAQLTFQEEVSQDICTVRRELTVSSRGKIGMSVTGLEELGLPDLAIETGTLMPGIAAHMRFDEKTTFAQAIAQLTGLKPLEDLGRRSARIVKRLKNDETKAARKGAQEKLTEFNERRQNIVDAWSAQSDLGESAELVAPDQQKEDKEEDTSKISIADARKLLTDKKQALENTAEIILGTSLQLASDNEVNTLLQQLRKAADILKTESLAALPSVATIKNLRAVSDDDCKVAEALIQDMFHRAQPVAERLRNKQEAARWQLYAKVAAWHSEHHQNTELRDCPVCGTDLEKVPPDSLLDKAVKDALALCRRADADASKGAKDWEQDAAREFLDGLPESLRTFADKAPPDDLLSIYRKAYAEELLADQAFANRLTPLKRNAGQVWALATKDNRLPDAPTLQVIDLPEEFRAGRLAQRIKNTAKAVALSKHRTESTEPIKALVERYIGVAGQTEAEDSDLAANTRPLRDQIEAVRMCVENTAPIISILRQLDDLEKTRKQYTDYIERLILIEQAAAAIEAFAGFEDLVYQQVSGLIQALDTDTRNWLDTIYSPHYRGGPAYSGIDLVEQTGLGLRATLGGMQVPAYKIMNASLLRACVWAFVFSLWDRVKARLGGLDCMLLDDPQTHFDPINAENLAAAIPQMPEHGMRPLITSNDNRFIASIRDKLPNRSTASPTWHAWTLNPISSSRLTGGVSPAVEEIFERLQEWQEDDNNASKAQQFVSTVRLYVENRLWDLLATDPMVMHKPTLADLVQSVRTAHNNGERPFEEPPFRALLSHRALRDNAAFYRIINKAHHRLHEVTPHEAGEVADSFKEIDRLLRSCSASYARFMGRLTREDRDLYLGALPPLPDRVTLNKAAIPLLGEVSARSHVDKLAGAETAQDFDLDYLGEIALFGVRSPGLGALALQGQVVAVSLEKEARDGDPVIALCGEKIYCRRFFGDPRDPSRISLACDRSGTERVPPTLVLPRAQTRLLPIIGVFYEEERFDGKEEACAVATCKLLDRNLVAVRVSEDSAYPVIRNGDIALLEAVENLDDNEIAHLEDGIVVAVMGSEGDSFAYLKRLGSEVSPGIRIFENVGMKGNALAVATNAQASAPNIQKLQKLWRVHGTFRTWEGLSE